MRKKKFKTKKKSDAAGMFGLSDYLMYSIESFIFVSQSFFVAFAFALLLISFNSTREKKINMKILSARCYWDASASC